MRNPLLVGFLLTVAPGVARSQGPIGPADLLVAGVGYGRDSNHVRKVLGRPDSISAEPDVIEQDSKNVVWHYSALVVIYYSDGVAGAVTLISPARATRRGLRVGDPAAKIRSLYGPPQENERSGDSEEWEYSLPDHPRLLISILCRKGRVVEIFMGLVRD